MTRPAWPVSVSSGQPNICSKRGLTMVKRRSRVTAMPMTALARIASRSNLACSVAEMSRALMTR
jgi:hypothetical protein